MDQKRSTYIPTLDGWRAVSILAVICCHFFERLSSGWLFEVTRLGSHGVDLFFSISGYLITNRLIETRIDEKRLDYKGFYIRRFFRILPPYFLLLSFLSMLYILKLAPISFDELLSGIFFLRNYFDFEPPFGEYTGHLWSIAVEEHFYLLFPFILGFLGYKRKRTVLVLVSLALIVGFWRNYSFLHHAVRVGVRTDTRIDSLIWGAVLALLTRDEKFRILLSRSLKGFGWVLLTLVCLLCVYYKPKGFSLYFPILTPLILFGTVAHPKRFFSKILESAPFLWVGRISYSLYLWNSVWMPGHSILPITGYFSALQASYWSWVSTFAAAWLSYVLLEKKMIGLGSKLSKA